MVAPFVAVCRGEHERVAGVELGGGAGDVAGEIRAAREGAPGLLHHASKHQGARIIGGGGAARIEGVDGDVVAIGEALDDAGVGEAAQRRAARGRREAFGDDEDCGAPRHGAQLRGQRPQRRQDDLRAPGLDQCRRAAERFFLEQRARLVDALAPLEGGDGAAEAVAVRRQANGGERIERLEHQRDVAVAQPRVDERRQRLAHPRRVGRIDVKLVEQDREAARLRLARLDRINGAHDAVFSDLEIFRAEAADGTALAVRDRRADAHAAGRGVGQCHGKSGGEQDHATILPERTGAGGWRQGNGAG